MCLSGGGSALPLVQLCAHTACVQVRPAPHQHLPSVERSTLLSTTSAPHYLVDDAPRGRTRQHVVALGVKCEEPAPRHLHLLVAAVTGQDKGACGVGGEAVLRHLEAALVDVPLDELRAQSTTTVSSQRGP